MGNCLNAAELLNENADAPVLPTVLVAGVDTVGVVLDVKPLLVTLPNVDIFEPVPLKGENDDSAIAPLLPKIDGVDDAVVAVVVVFTLTSGDDVEVSNMG